MNRQQYLLTLFQRHRQFLAILLNLGIGPLVLLHYSKHLRNQEEERLAKLEIIVRSLLSGHLRPNADGVILLPQELKSLTQDGKVYQCRDKAKGKLWFFPTKAYSRNEEHADWQTNKKVTKNWRFVSGYLYSADPPLLDWLPYSNCQDVYTANEWKRSRSNWWYAEPLDD